MRGYVCAAALALCAAGAAPAAAQPIRLSFSEALARAREQSPTVVVARARIEEARGRLVGARVRFRDNPQLSVSAGPRRSGGETTSDIEAGLSQTFETGGQRAARIAGADAVIAAHNAGADDVQRLAIEAVARAYLAHERAQQRRALLSEAERTAAEILRIAERRYNAGDIAALDVNLARAAASRARAAAVSAGADLTAANGVLVRLLNFEPSIAITVDDSLDRDRTADLNTLLDAVRRRPDLVAARSAIAEAEADVRLGSAMRRPDLGVDLRARKEGADRIVVAGLTVTLPWANHGQELAATGTARAARARLELENAERTAVAEVTALHEEYAQRRSAAAAFAEALPAATDNQQLSQRSYEEGELSLPDLIVVGREVIDTRLGYLDLLFEAADAAVARDTAAGVLR